LGGEDRVGEGDKEVENFHDGVGRLLLGLLGSSHSAILNMRSGMRSSSRSHWWEICESMSRKRDSTMYWLLMCHTNLATTQFFFFLR
jgi:hypothetical protein